MKPVSAIHDSFLCLYFVVLLHTVASSCDNPLGMADRRIADYQLRSSSSGQFSWYRGLVRLTDSSTEAWMPSNDDQVKWFQVDFRSPVFVTAIATQGRDVYVDPPWWNPYRDIGYIETYRVTSSNDVWPAVWSNVSNNQGQMEFMGNTNGNDIVKRMFSDSVYLRYIRIHIENCYESCYLRFELYGCQALLMPNTSPLPPTSKASVITDAKEITTTSTVKLLTDKDKQSTTPLSLHSTSSSTTMARVTAIATTPTVTTQSHETQTADEVLPSTTSMISLGLTSATTNENNAKEIQTTQTIRVQTGKEDSTMANLILDSPEQQLARPFSGPVIGSATGGIILVLIITAAACVVFRRKRSQPKPESGLQYDGPYELTVEGSILPPTTPGPHIYQNTSNGVLSDEDNNRCRDINHNKNIDGETYAEIPENDANKRKRSSNKDGLVDIYAASQYGGRPSSTAADDKTENRHNAQSNSQLYAKVDRKKPKPGLRSDEAGSPRTSAEGWMDNDIYATGDAEAADDGHGWRDNSIYATTDNGDERDHREEGWEDNGIYAGGN